MTVAQLQAQLRALDPSMQVFVLKSSSGIVDEVSSAGHKPASRAFGHAQDPKDFGLDPAEHVAIIYT